MNCILFMTSGVESLIGEGTIKDSDLILSFNKFILNDWGVLCDEDKEFQMELLKNPKAKYKDRFMGVYIINEKKIWIISDYDCSIKKLVITILLPEEY